jgi:ATP-dependent Clp protease, protease subunit
MTAVRNDAGPSGQGLAAGFPSRPGQPRPPEPLPPLTPTRVWLNPGERPGSLYERLLEQRILMASGQLDGEAATGLCAQLLTLDAEGDEPIRLELQGLSADLPAALTVMGVLDVVGVPVHARASGQVSGSALGVLAACGDRRAYPHAVFALSEPRLDFDGTATDLAAQQEQLRLMLDALYFRLAEVTGREVDQIRDDARQRRLLTAEQAITYGLLQGRAEAR